MCLVYDITYVPKRALFEFAPRCGYLRLFAGICARSCGQILVLKSLNFQQLGPNPEKCTQFKFYGRIKLPGHCWYLQNANQLVRHVKRELPYYAASPSEGFSICWISSQTSTLQRACRREWICFEPTDIRELQHIDLKTKGLLLVFLPERLHSRLPFHRDPTGTNRPSHWFTIGPWNLV